jgi:hypothetical protein
MNSSEIAIGNLYINKRSSRIAEVIGFCEETGYVQYIFLDSEGNRIPSKWMWTTNPVSFTRQFDPKEGNISYEP